MKHRVLLLLIAICSTAWGQQPARQQKIDSLSTRLRKDSAFIFRKTIAKPYLRVENRRSFIVKESVNFLGFLVGANLYERHVLSAGYYFLDKDSRGPIHLERNGHVTQQFSRLNYFVFSYQYILLNYRYLQLNTPLEVGYGGYGALVTDTLLTGGVSEHNGNFLPLGGGLQVILKPLRWVGVSASGGYRHVEHNEISLRFNGWYYSFGLWVDARYLFRASRYYLRKQQYRKEVMKLQEGSI